MGCCSGKGSDLSIESLKDMQTEPTGVGSVDAFGEQVNALLKSIQEIGVPFIENKNKILKLTGFKGKRHATLEHVLLGIFLLVGANLPNHDFSSINLRLTDESPFIAGELNAVKGCKDADEALTIYGQFISDALVALAEKTEELVKTSVELGKAGATVVTDAKGEFEGLGTFEKITAVAKAMKVVKASVGVPLAVKAIIGELQQSKEDAKSVKDQLQDKQTFLTFVKKAKGAKDCYDAYVRAFGVPKPVDKTKKKPQPKK